LQLKDWRTTVKSWTIAIVVLLSIGACTTTDEIIIDKKGVNMSAYSQDLAECREYSSEVQTGEKAARGAGSGAVVGGLVGAVVGGSDSAARGAGVGAVTGGARGVNEGEKDKVKVVKRCLRGRGYKVLN
jgi:outer membrane lipoprotein SlyB